MKNSLWKLTALAGVVGVVMLAFLQAQHGLNTSNSNEFLPAELDDVEKQPQLGAASPMSALVDDPAASGATTAVGVPGAVPASEHPFDAVDPVPSGPDEFAAVDDPWGADEPPAERRSASTDPGLTTIRPRDDTGRDDNVRTVGAANDEFGDGPAFGAANDPRAPAILPAAADLRPVPAEGAAPTAGDEFGPGLFLDDPQPAPLDESPASPAAPTARDEFADETPPPSAGFDDFPPLDAPRQTGAEEFPPLDAPTTADADDAPPSTPPVLLPLPDDSFDDKTFDDKTFDDKTFDDKAFDDKAFDDKAFEGDAFDADVTRSPPSKKLVPPPLPASDEFGDASSGETFDPNSFDSPPQPPASTPGRVGTSLDGPGIDGPMDDPVERTRVEPPPTDEAPAFGDEFPPSDDMPALRAPEGPTLEPVPVDPPRATFAENAPPSTTELDPTYPIESRPAPSRVVSPEDAEHLAPLTKNDLLGDGTLDPASPVAAQKPQLTIEKIAPEVAVLGKPLVYTIIVENVGQTLAREVIVEDRIPKGTELTGTIPRAELIDKTLRWKLGSLQPGQSTKIAVRVKPIEEGQIGSIATVNFVAEVGARTRITSPQLAISLSGPERAKLGQPVMFQFDVENTGSGRATGVVIRDLVPAGLHHPGGDDLEYAVGDLGPGEKKSIRLSLTARQEGEVVNRAIVSADGGLESEAKATVHVDGVQLAVARTGPTKRYVGRSAIFSNAVTNNGAIPVTGVTVVETLPEGVEFVEAASGGQYNPARREIAWRIERLGPKESTVLKVKLLSKSTGTFTSQVTATSESGQKAVAEAVTEAVGFTALGLDIEGGGPPVFVGDTVTFKVIANNRGSSNAGNVEVSVAISPELKLVSVNAPVKYTLAGNEVRFAPVPNLGGRATADFELQFRAIKPGDGRVRARIQADDLDTPLLQEESIRVVAETP